MPSFYEIADNARRVLSSTVTESHNKDTAKVRQWLADQYDDFPQGINRINKSSRENTVQVVLSEPIKIPIISEVLEEEGYYLDVSEARDGHSMISFYEVLDTSGGSQKHLRGTFHEEKEIPLGERPIRDDNPNERLWIIARYLDRKFP